MILSKQFLILALLAALFLTLSFIPRAEADVYDTFHTKEEKITMWKTLWNAHPNNTEYVSVGETFGGFDIMLFAAGNHDGGRVLWDGEMHGNEDKGSEILFLMAKWLLESGDPRAEEILEQNYVLFIPVVNSNDGRGNGDTKNSPFGVDLNRNFAAGWVPSTPNDDVYSGPYPFSEPETLVMRKVFAYYKPTFYVNMHVGGGPYAAYYNKGNATLRNNVLTRYDELSYQMGAMPYAVRNFSRSRGFSMGDAVELGVQSAWLIEAIGRNTAWQHLKEDYDELVTLYFPKCLPLFIAMCELSGSVSPPPTDSPRILTVSQYPIQKGVHAHDDVRVFVTLSESAIELKRVSLNYASDNGTQFTVDMKEVGRNLWTCKIPAVPSSSNVTYTVTAENCANVEVTSDALSYSYESPQNSSFRVFPLIVLLILVVIVLLMRRRS